MATLPSTQSPAPLYYSGKIDQTVFTVSCSILFAVGSLAAAIRFYIRFGIQKTISIDDGFLLFALLSLTTSIGLAFTTLGSLYVLQAFLIGQTIPTSKLGALELSFGYHKFEFTILILCWTTVCCVKFSFLFLFRRLINRLRWVVVYWWIVLIFVGVSFACGITAYIAACPYFGSAEAAQCVSPSNVRKAIDYGIIESILDILGDIMILVIPIHLIWKIKIGKRQKFWLATSLCLTIFMIGMTLVRLSGFLSLSGDIDVLWSMYWNIISAEVGIILTSATSFRVFFIAKASTSNHEGTRRFHQSWISSVIGFSKRFIERAIHPKNWVIRKGIDSEKSSESAAMPNSFKHPKHVDQLVLNKLPRAHLTGIRTIIRDLGQGLVSTSTEGIMQSHWEEESKHR